jgi:hypothetical protein
VRGGKKLVVIPFFEATNFSKLKIIHFLNAEEKIWTSFQRIIELFTPKFVTKLLKIWVWDQGSGKNLFRIPDPGSGVKKAPDPGSATLLSGHKRASTQRELTEECEIDSGVSQGTVQPCFPST